MEGVRGGEREREWEKEATAGRKEEGERDEDPERPAMKADCEWRFGCLSLLHHVCLRTCLNHRL